MDAVQCLGLLINQSTLVNLYMVKSIPAQPSSRIPGEDTVACKMRIKGICATGTARKKQVIIATGPNNLVTATFRPHD